MFSNLRKNGGEYFYYQNERFLLKVYVWLEFNDLEINLFYDGKNIRIEPYWEDPKLTAKRRKISLFFYNDEQRYWNLIGEIVKSKIKKTIE